MKTKSWLAVLLATANLTALGQSDDYGWSQQPAMKTIASEIPVPEGFQRKPVSDNSFASWLRYLPVKPDGTPVRLHNGSKKWNQLVHAAVIDIDTGSRDLQQCADAVMRLRAEYLYSADRFDDIHFNFSSGDRADFSRWAEGYRPLVNGNKVSWQKRSEESSNYKNFRKYLNSVFSYAGSYSLSKELKNRESITNMEIGDVFIQGGFPGHAVIVVDMAENPETGEKLFLLAQSYMPAQDIHILINPLHSGLSPWYSAPSGERLVTPEWLFNKSDLKYFSE